MLKHTCNMAGIAPRGPLPTQEDILCLRLMSQVYLALRLSAQPNSREMESMPTTLGIIERPNHLIVHPRAAGISSETRNARITIVRSLGHRKRWKLI
jgi:hypothetical protein